MALASSLVDAPGPAARASVLVEVGLEIRSQAGGGGDAVALVPRAGFTLSYGGSPARTVAAPASSRHRVTASLRKRAGLPSQGALTASQTAEDTLLHEFVGGELRDLEGLLGGACPPAAPRTIVRHDVAARLRCFLSFDGEPVLSQDFRNRIRCEVDLTEGASWARGAARAGCTSTGGAPRPNIDQWEVVAEATSQARRLLDATSRRPRTTATPVVFGPGAGGAFIHELVGHALEADNYLRSGSYLSNSLGRRMMDYPLTVVDDPQVAGGWGSCEIDDEGNRSTPVVLVDNGVVAGLLTSTATTSATRQATGHGRRERYSSPALPRATNTVVRQGPQTLAAVEEPSKHGILRVLDLGSGEINPSTGVYAFSAREAEYRTPDGHVIPLRDVLLTGDALDTLQTISAVASDSALDNVTCGKADQYVGIGLASPSIRFDRINWN